jgi:adenosine deaminase
MPVSLDLHVHLRGTVKPCWATAYARKLGVSFPSHYLNAKGKYTWSSFEEFLTIYDKVGRIVSTPEILSSITREYLLAASANGTIYTEFMLSPNHSEANGIPLAEQLAAVAEGIQAAQAASGIEARLIITCVRHRGGDEATDLAERTVAELHPIVVGFGLTGNERKLDVSEFAAGEMLQPL